ncbi:MAG: hypothetical protein U1C46_00360 [Bacteroidales bacterium]|nr:hypothetical protein [Bacteroidales bacterium]
MKKFWWIEKVEVICTMPSGGPLKAIAPAKAKPTNLAIAFNGRGGYKTDKFYVPDTFPVGIATTFNWPFNAMATPVN